MVACSVLNTCYKAETAQNGDGTTKHHCLEDGVITDALDEASLNRWSVVAAVCLASSLNAFLCMSFSASEKIVATALGVRDDEVAPFYTAYLLAVMFFLTPVLWQSERWEGGSLVMSVLASTVAAWLRWWALHSNVHPYGLCMISQVLVGFGACAISVVPGQVSHQRFGPQDWPFTTSLMLMANYFGWMCGVVVAQMVLGSDGSVESLVGFFSNHCMYSLVVSISVLILYKPMPEKAAEETRQENGMQGSLSGFLPILRTLRSPQFSLQLGTHGLLGGIGFFVPSAVCFVFATFDFSDDVLQATEIAFIGTGVAGGVFLGAISAAGISYRHVLKVCYLLGSFSTITICVVAFSDLLDGVWRKIGMVATMAIAGFATLGFTGVAMEDLSRFRGVKSSYVAWITYELILAIGAGLHVFAAYSWSLLMVAVAAIGSCAIFIACSTENPYEPLSFGS
eukprot:TRINITY_DN9457_c0_g1_i1.p1 TRINITY_DN9457_c0_g1~~TRINITY_DN9457_c0_g1_i1.p1  ORF type:complete len:481 (-),score=43.99 TRINITY_DN9457_c0_g1_i1:102-1460(-)